MRGNPNPPRPPLTPAPSRFTADDVTFIRHPLQQLSDNKLADLFLCNPAQIREARNGTTWSNHHLPPREASPRSAVTRRI